MIKTYPVENGTLYRTEAYHVIVTNDGRWFTVYDTLGQPRATITRPAVHGGNRKWEAHATDGTAIYLTGAGPRGCLARVIDFIRRESK